MITQQWNAQTLQYLYLVYHLTWKSFIGHQIYWFSALSIIFLDYMDRNINSTGKLLLTGDFNINVNDLESPDTNTFLDVLDSFGLQNHISFPTHHLNNTLDLVISSGQDNFIESSTPGRLYTDIHKLKNINMTNFNKVVELHLTTNYSDKLPLSGKIWLYRRTLEVTLDKHAQLKMKKVPDRVKIP